MVGKECYSHTLDENTDDSTRTNDLLLRSHFELTTDFHTKLNNEKPKEQWITYLNLILKRKIDDNLFKSKIIDQNENSKILVRIHLNLLGFRMWPIC